MKTLFAYHTSPVAPFLVFTIYELENNEQVSPVQKMAPTSTPLVYKQVCSRNFQQIKFSIDRKNIKR